jgi:hypothetical protein
MQNGKQRRGWMVGVLALLLLAGCQSRATLLPVTTRLPGGRKTGGSTSSLRPRSAVNDQACDTRPAGRWRCNQACPLRLQRRETARCLSRLAEQGGLVRLRSLTRGVESCNGETQCM